MSGSNFRSYQFRISTWPDVEDREEIERIYETLRTLFISEYNHKVDDVPRDCRKNECLMPRYYTLNVDIYNNGMIKGKIEGGDKWHWWMEFECNFAGCWGTGNIYPKEVFTLFEFLWNPLKVSCEWGTEKYREMYCNEEDP